MSEAALALTLLRKVASQDPRERERGADEVTDVISSLERMGPAVAHALAVARIVETDVRAQEAQLHALAELAEWDNVPSEVREMLTVIDSTALADLSQREYLDYLLLRPGDEPGVTEAG